MTIEDDLVVDIGWLRAHSDDHNITILDATVQKDDARIPPYFSGRDHFEDHGHIPGARHVDLLTELSDPDARFPFTRPRRDQVERLLTTLGVGANSTIVIYDTRGGAWAARALWVLRSWGLTRIALLDGSLADWAASGGVIAYGSAHAHTASVIGPVTLDDHDRGFVDLPDVEGLAAGTRGGRLISAAATEIYNGEREVAGRRGHIPRSVDVSYRDFVISGDRVDLSALRARLDELGISPDEPIVTYCGGGVDASGLAVALWRLGSTNVAVYDGSLSEWNSHPGRPLE
ncbi:MAG: rhodanese-like domain-containing protein [Gordonia sp. (in: high G+C Gram-positive bacteria)]